METHFVQLGKSLLIGKNTKLSILGRTGNQVKIGIEAPRNVSVYREEIYRKIQRQKTT